MSPRNLHNVLLKRHFSNCWKTKLHETNPSAFYYHRFYSSEQRTVSESILSIWEALLDEWHSFSPKPATTSCVTLRKKKSCWNQIHTECTLLFESSSCCSVVWFNITWCSFNRKNEWIVTNRTKMGCLTGDWSIDNEFAHPRVSPQAWDGCRLRGLANSFGGKPLLGRGLFVLRAVFHRNFTKQQHQRVRRSVGHDYAVQFQQCLYMGNWILLNRGQRTKELQRV